MKLSKVKHSILVLSFTLLGSVLVGCSNSSTPSVPEKNQISSTKSGSGNSNENDNSGNKTKSTSNKKSGGFFGFGAKHTSNTNSAATYSSSWTNGVPAKYRGYYGRHSAYGEDKAMDKLTIQNKSVSFGLGDTMIMYSPKYMQVAPNEFVIRGIDNHYDAEHPVCYIKIRFTVKNGVTQAGISSLFSNSTDKDPLAKAKSANLSKKNNVGWYSKYKSKKALDAAADDYAKGVKTKSSSSSNSGTKPLKYTLTDKDGKKYKSIYTIDQMRKKYDLPYREYDNDGEHMIANKYEGNIQVNPLVHDGSKDESYASGSLRLQGTYVYFGTRATDGALNDTYVLINIENGERYNEDPMASF